MDDDIDTANYADLKTLEDRVRRTLFAHGFNEKTSTPLGDMNSLCRNLVQDAAATDAELAALRQRLEQAENRERLALTEIKTLKDEKAALEARFALAVELAEAALKADLLLNGGLPFVGTPAEDRFYEALDAYCAAKKEANHES